MKQVLQHARTGEISVTEVPAPQLLPGCVLVRMAASLVSAGTERASSEFARKSLLQKAQARPDLVRDVVSKVRRDGLLSAVQAVRSRLDQPTALGYSSSGTVVEVAGDVPNLAPGDRVACAGAGFAVHAEFACVPRLLVAKIPDDSVTFEESAFSTVGAVALHGIRTADVNLGDVVAVIGLGLLGQLTAQLLKAGGCRVLGMDIVRDRAELAARLGADAVCSSAAEFRELCASLTGGFGADAVLITAETPSSEPVNLAAQVARDRAVVVAVGTVGMELERQRYYEKELDFRISRSYGPGRYDAAFEQKGRDYPIGHVRWTETRNMEGFLRFLADRKLDLRPLITHRFPVDEAHAAYELISGRTPQHALGVLFLYPEETPLKRRLEVASTRLSARSAEASVRIGLLGAGSFATGTLLPAMHRVGGMEFVGVAAATGSHSRVSAEKFKFSYCTTDENEILGDARINTVVIATRHHLHARQVLSALAAGKHVFCEKPLCLTERELAEIARAREGGSGASLPALMVGFNRRFSPMARQMRSFLDVKEPLAMHYRINAGALPPDHWINDPDIGGGRVLGEVGHFVDLLSFLCGSNPVTVEARPLASSGQRDDSSVLISLHFANGSEGTIHYLVNGDRSFSKERVEIFGGGGAVAVLEDFRRLEMTRFGRKTTVTSRWRQDKGHRAEWQAFAECIRSGGPEPIPFDSIVTTTLTTLCVAKARASGQLIAIDRPGILQRASLQNDSEN